MSKDASKKLYVCNRKRCRNCYSACNLTSDVRFAAVDDTVVIADGITGAWIPCSEKLPGKGGVIVQYNDGDFDLLEFPTAYRRADIVAWMPLPEPYKEGAGE